MSHPRGTYIVDMPPGAVMVVGPQGRFAIGIGYDNNAVIHAENCDFIGPRAMTPAHSALVDEVWARRTETGAILRPTGGVPDLPESLRELMTAPSIDPVPPQPTRTLWQRILSSVAAYLIQLADKP